MGKHGDKIKKQAIAYFVETQNYAEVGRKYKVSANTVKKWVSECPEIAEKLTHKKEETTKDILEQMENNAGAVMKFADYVLTQRLNPDTNRRELDSLPARELATIYGITMDKALKVKELSTKISSEGTAENNIAKALHEVFE